MNPPPDPGLVGALVPLSRPGWIEAGHHLLAGLEMAVRDVNHAGGISGRPLQLVVRDTAADPRRAEAAVDDLAHLGVLAVAGEYHSVAARAAATRADTLSLPFLCSSAVLDRLTEQPTEWVARLAPPQSQGWRIYAEFLQRAGYRRIGVVAESSPYWEAGTRILRNCFAARGGTVIDMDPLAPAVMSARRLDTHTQALLLLVNYPEPAVSIVQAVRRDQHLEQMLIGAPAGKPEFADWATLLGADGAAIPFLRYVPNRLSALGARVERSLRDRLAETPSFVALEGYDAVIVLADMLRSRGTDWSRPAPSWPQVDVEGTRGRIKFSRTAGINMWQGSCAPIQVVDRDPADISRFRLLHSTGRATQPPDRSPDPPSTTSPAPSRTRIVDGE